WIGPLLNSNNLAGYVNLGLFAGAGLLLEARFKRLRVWILVGMLALLAMLLMSSSRAGVLSALLGAGAVFPWLRQKQLLPGSLRRFTWVLAPAAVLAGLALAFDMSRKVASLASLDFNRKLAGWLWSLPMIREHAWVGVGRGAFETAFPPYR